MSRLEIEWPDASIERCRAAQGRLLAAGRVLQTRPLEDRLAAVAAVLGDWTAADSPWRRELAAELAQSTPFSAGTIEEGLTSALRAWHVEDFVRCARAELASAGGERRLVPYRLTTVLAGGAIPMPTLLSGLLPLVLGSPVLLRETSKDEVTAGLLARSLEARDDGLARAFERIALPWTDDAAFSVLLEAPCIVATGSDETLASIARRLGPDQRFVGYGHRFSIAVLGPMLARDPLAMRAAAEGLALDVARWDQSGCLSPVVAYLVGMDGEARERFARATSEALESLEADMPRGELQMTQLAGIANERAQAMMRSPGEGSVLLEGAAHTVLLDSDAEPRPAPLGRFLRMQPVDSIAALVRVVTPFAGHLSNAALAGFEGFDATNACSGFGTDIDSISAPESLAVASTEQNVPGAERLSNSLLEMGVSRLTRPGRLQTPAIDWPHDGIPLFMPLARFAQSESRRDDGT